MKIIFIQNIAGPFMRMGKLLIIIAAYTASTSAHAGNDRIEPLQKAASAAYEKMMQEKNIAENAAKDAAFAKKKFESLKQKLNATEQEYISAERKSEQAKRTFEQAAQQWQQASDTLSLEWNKTQESE
ncbi:MAG: hypothetical protein LZF61_03560 [Nitrosomonas sp.]|nr:MAG: hypothetical protein LZF61_03560 [Nitrosomonas sp.]